MLKHEIFSLCAQLFHKQYLMLVNPFYRVKVIKAFFNLLFNCLFHSRKSSFRVKYRPQSIWSFGCIHLRAEIPNTLPCPRRLIQLTISKTGRYVHLWSSIPWHTSKSKQLYCLLLSNSLQEVREQGYRPSSITDDLNPHFSLPKRALQPPTYIIDWIEHLHPCYWSLTKSTEIIKPKGKKPMRQNISA